MFWQVYGNLRVLACFSRFGELVRYLRVSLRTGNTFFWFGEAVSCKVVAELRELDRNAKEMVFCFHAMCCGVHACIEASHRSARRPVFCSPSRLLTLRRRRRNCEMSRKKNRHGKAYCCCSAFFIWISIDLATCRPRNRLFVRPSGNCKGPLMVTSL